MPPSTVVPKLHNDNLVLIVGPSGGGKSASLRDLKIPTGVAYMNTESNKKLPFPSTFKKLNIIDPLQVNSGFEVVEPDNTIHTIVVDSLTFMMDMYESIHVLTAKDTMQAWSNFQQFFKRLMQYYVAKSTKNVIFTAHVQSILNENEHVMERKVPIKGALKANGIEAYFSTVVSARSMAVTDLANYKNSLLTITPEEEAIGVKYVFQTRLTKETVHERIRSAMGMWSQQETFIDNNAQFLMDRLHKYYI